MGLGSIICLFFAGIAFFGPFTTPIPDGPSPMGMSVMNTLIEYFSPIAGQRTFSYLMGSMSLILLLSGWFVIRKKRVRPEKLSTAQSQNDFAHLEKKVWAEDQHPFHIRLVPQIPIRNKSTSWFGGHPYMPASINWPIGTDGLPMQFLAQLDLSQVPDKLWDGLGPRSGWLVFFTNYEFGGAKVIHITDFGQARIAPPIPQSRVSEYGHWFNVHYLDYAEIKRLGKTLPFDHRPPYWPVDIVPVAEGSRTHEWNYWRPRGGRSPLGLLRQTGYDLREERLAPFDWHSVWLLVHASQRKVWSIQETLRRWLDKAQSGIENLELKRPDGYMKEIEARRSEAVVFQSNLDVLATTEAKLLALEESALELAKHHPFTAEIRDDYFAQITQLPIPRCRDWGNKESDYFSLISTPDSKSGLSDYLNLLLQYVKRLYSGSLKCLNPPMLDFLLNEVKYFGSTEFGLSGHHAIDALPAFNNDHEIGLLQLPSSGLMGWEWGDVYDVVFSIPKADLKSHNFENVELVVTN